MNEKDLLLGPVLSFRGTEGGRWHVTALLGLKETADLPVLDVDGHACPNPTELLLFKGERYVRYDLSCDLRADERKVSYGVPGGLRWHMTIPGQGYSPRMAYVSCNGFSDPALMRKLIRASDAVWEDLLYSHDRDLRTPVPDKPSKHGPPPKLLDKEQLWHEHRIHDKGLQRFHLMLMGGDQIYFDSIWEDIKALRRWVSLPRQEQIAFKVTPTLDREIEAYYLQLYRKRWRPEERPAWGAGRPPLDAATAMAHIPTIMMWDDHDIFDGWGSYSGEMQASPLFQTLFRHARRAFWVFQMQHALEDLPALEDDTPAGFIRRDPVFKVEHRPGLLARDPLALPLLAGQPGFTCAYEIGPVALIAADLRTERSRHQVLGPATWDAIKNWLGTLEGSDAQPQPPQQCQHLLFMSSVPVVHPKLSLAEALLDNFGSDHVTDSNADDLKDHWSHDDHDGERKRLLEVLSHVARDQRIRVSILSGDVHVAAWGTAYRKDLPASETWSQIHQLTSSAVVHPSLVGLTERLFLHWLNSAAKDLQKIDVQSVAEMMLFPGHDRHVMAARNWLALELDTGSDGTGCKLWATWRCEQENEFSNHLLAVAPVR